MDKYKGKKERILSSFLVKCWRGKVEFFKNGDDACETSTINLLPFLRGHCFRIDL